MSQKTAPFPLPVLLEELRLAALDLSAQEPDPALTAARFADGLRDAGLPAPAGNEWKQQIADFDAEAWHRLEILTRAFRESAVAPLVAARLKAEPKRAGTAFPTFCMREAQLLSRDLLLKSPFLVEELARKWVFALGGEIAGESPSDSQRKMERLDFGGVLSNLKKADADRASRMKKLKELEEKRLKEEQEAYARAGRE
jgi:hypothetical protein